MAKNHPTEQDFLKMVTAQTKPNDVASTGLSAPAKPTMKLNRPPSGPKISTEELYNQELEREQAKDNATSPARADIFLNELPSVGEVRKVSLNLIDDSPYQPRLRYDPIKLDTLGLSLQTAGQVEPITVRIIGDRFELLGGHRRCRAARSIGWNEIDAYVKECDDFQAEKIALLQNEGREDLSEYERGKVYKRALERGFAKTQTELASMFGCSQPTVSNCMKLLSLPDEIKSFLEATPSLFGTALAKVLFDLLKDYPNELPLLVEGIQRVANGAETTNFRTWFMMKISSRNRGSKKKETSVVTGKSGKTLFTAKVDNGKVQISLGEGIRVDEQTVAKWVIAALRERADQADIE